MNRRTTRIIAALLAATAMASVSVGGATAHRSDLDAARSATGRFHSLRQADAAGYAQPPAPAPLHECISSFDGTGAMGFHYINGGLLDTSLDATRPEVLVYAPDRHGHLKLAALEYVVFQAPWKALHGDEMPALFGQMFMTTGEPNRFDIPAFYSLHVWLWKDNPAGMFAPFNPRVSCDGGGPSDGRTGEEPISRVSVNAVVTTDRKPLYSCETAAAAA